MLERATLAAMLAVAEAGTASDTGTPPILLEDFFAEHGGSDRNGDAYPSGSARYTYTGGSGSQALVRAATSDIIHNAAGAPDNVHLRYTGMGAYSGGAQYVETTVTSLDSGSGVPELYVRLSAADAGTAVYLSTSAFQLFDWTGTTFTGITSAAVSLSTGTSYTFWIYVDDANVISAGVLGLGILISGVTEGTSGVRAAGHHGLGWFRPAGATVMPLTQLLLSDTRPSYV